LHLIETQAASVGIVPRQIFAVPHPKRLIMPTQPNFGNARFVPLFRLSIPARHLHFHRNLLFIVRADSTVLTLTFAKTAKAARPEFESSVLGSISQFLSIPAEEGTVTAHSFAYFVNAGRLVSTSLWDGSFHVFRIDAGQLSHSVTVRQKFALLATLHFAGESLLLASWRDSSLTLWNLADARAAQQPLYRKTPHLAAVVDVDVNHGLRLIASLDKGRECILSMLDDGGFVRAFAVDGTDALQRVMLFAAGFVAVLGHGRAAGAPGATVRACGIDGRAIARVDFAEVAVEWCRAEFETTLSALAVAFRGGRVVVFRAPDLAVLCDVRCTEEVRLLAFAVQLNCFVAGTAAGEVCILSLD
jgi:hypothetical protein